MIRQGDVLLVPVAEVPPEAELQAERTGVRIVGERGDHVHVLEGLVAVNGPTTYVRGGAILRHENVSGAEEHGLHAPLQTEPVWYEVRQQREHVPLAPAVRRWD